MEKIRERTVKAIANIGYSMSNVGFIYICDMLELFENDEFLLTNTMKAYEDVANMNKSTVDRVRIAITYAFDWMLTCGRYEYVVKYLESTEKRANSKLLVTLYNNIKEIKE